MKCPMCEKEMIWQTELDYTDFNIDSDDDGIVGIYTCHNEQCNVQDVHIFTPLNNDNAEM
jgi:hypothetical protein